jgi:hypothetical protein
MTWSPNVPAIIRALRTICPKKSLVCAGVASFVVTDYPRSVAQCRGSWYWPRSQSALHEQHGIKLKPTDRSVSVRRFGEFK